MLVRRYSETRHRHPLDDQNDGVQSAIMRERVMLDEIRDMAQTTIDTSDLAFRQLRERIITALGALKRPALVAGCCDALKSVDCCCLKRKYEFTESKCAGLL